MGVARNADEPKEVNIHGAVKTNRVGDKYIELILFYDCEGVENVYKRFIIKKGCMMDPDDEIAFDEAVRNEFLSIDMNEFIYFQEEVSSYLPELGLRAFYGYEIGMFLDYIYYASHKSGAREILYKARLERRAYYLFNVEGYNLIGRNPADILGVPKKLINVLYEAHLEETLFEENSRAEAAVIYAAFSDYFGKEKKPNKYQWEFIRKYGQIDDKGKGHLDTALYRRLDDCKTAITYKLVTEYLELSEQLGKYNPYKKCQG